MALDIVSTNVIEYKLNQILSLCIDQNFKLKNNKTYILRKLHVFSDRYKAGERSVQRDNNISSFI